MRVCHGGLYLDNSDGLPGEEQMDDPAEFPDRWIALDNGDYRAEVTAILRQGGDSLPDYVIRFTPADLGTTPPVDAPPDLRAVPDWKPRAEYLTETGYGLWPAGRDLPERCPVLQAPVTGDPIPFGSLRASLPETEADALDHWLGDEFLVPVGDDGSAVLARYNGKSQIGDQDVTLRFQVILPAQIGARGQDGQSGYDLIAKPDMAADGEALRPIVTRAIASGRLKASAFEQERFAALDRAEPMTSWAILHAQITGEEKLRLYCLSATERIEGLRTALAS